MTRDEIVTALRCCVSVGLDCCKTCPAAQEDGCEDAIKVYAADALEKLLDRCARYAEEIAVLQERQRWIPVTERLPENGERVLAYCKDRVIHDVKWSWPQNAWFDKVTGREYFESFVTHWKPLPEEPEED